MGSAIRNPQSAIQLRANYGRPDRRQVRMKVAPGPAVGLRLLSLWLWVGVSEGSGGFCGAASGIERCDDQEHESRSGNHRWTQMNIDGAEEKQKGQSGMRDES